MPLAGAAARFAGPMTDDTAPVATVPVDFDPVPPLADKLGLARGSIAAVIVLLDEGNTVPFIARYRKERTGGLDEVQIRSIDEERTYMIELETRRAVILASVGEQGKLTPELEQKLRAATGKSELEDLYAPYRPRRKTRASVAREKGLSPLAEKISAQPATGEPLADAATFINAELGVATAEEALAGARDIVAELIADTAEVRAWVRKEYAEYGELVSSVVPNKSDEPTKFEQYYQFSEAVKTIPSHRFLAIRRGEAEGVLRAQVVIDPNRVGVGIERLVKLDGQSPWAHELHLAIADALKRLLAPSVENDVRAELKLRSDHAAVDIFAGNLRNLMLASPLGSAAVIGVDPGLRTGCKCAAIDATGKFLGTVTVFITQGDAQLAKAKDDFLAFVQAFLPRGTPRAIAVGNGTGGREAEAFVKKCLGDAGLREGPEAPFVVQVNEAGASVYSASDLAREEFPELDLTIRGAISIARRLQDPLAELVKIEPKSIGVGQYQHDVHQSLLGKKLGDVVEDCVNRVGVELNTASAQLLGYVAGIGKSLAKKIVLHRDANGAFSARGQLMDISGLGPKAYEQAAGFLKIPGATHPLDASSVHPESYGIVEKMAADLGVELPALIGNQELVDKLDLANYVEGEVGLPTLQDIASELAKPGRDPRAEFAPPAFRDDVTSMEDLKPGMVLEGIVTNVTAFGAFVDIGVHNDGLVHVSQLAEQFVKDPSEVVKVGQKLTVRVLEVDTARKRIALSAKRGREKQPPQQGQGQGQGPGPGQGPGQGQGQGQNRRGGRGRGGGGGPRPEGQQQQGQGRRGPRSEPPQPQPQGEPQHTGDQPSIEQQLSGEQPQGEQPSPQGDAPPQGDRRQWQNRGPQQQGGRGPHQGGGSPQQAGPRQDNRGPRTDRGPRQGGTPQQQGGPRQDNRGPRGPRQDNRNWQGGPPPQGDNRNWQGGPPPQGDNRNWQGGDRGPQQGGPPPQGDNRNWQGQGPRSDRGPRRDDRGPQQGGPRRDDRGPQQGAPRRDDQPRREGPPPENWGVGGFKNNPFSKLVPGADKPKR